MFTDVDRAGHGDASFFHQPGTNVLNDYLRFKSFSPLLNISLSITLKVQRRPGTFVRDAAALFENPWLVTTTRKTIITWFGVKVLTCTHSRYYGHGVKLHTRTNFRGIHLLHANKGRPSPLGQCVGYVYVRESLNCCTRQNRRNRRGVFFFRVASRWTRQGHIET